ncbi:DUF4252 domain-containing protein [Phaeocystidibacter luteus]|uniref:DUF4252 domain-containing protein n=1 Tax=Phaeocystidibacter luteus TaxID=911197 RepID=A0A6N6RIP7_9FLAO|nr:DUF4252 domain-containing protein [Phaeocystidibacter luteus]KAB2814210.1 DUF4252 domain-containing protein [Phaeocystidibacter luteus]
MKSTITLLLISAFSWVASGQVGDRIHDRLSEESGSLSLSMNQSLDDVIDGDFDLEDAGVLIQGEAHKTKVSIVSEENNNLSSLYHQIVNVLYNAGMEQILAVKEDDGQVTLWVEELNEEVDELHVLISGDDDGLVYVTLYGSFTVTER